MHMAGGLLRRYVDDMPQLEASRILMFAQGAGLPMAGQDAWTRMIDRSLPPASREETFFRYEGKPVRPAELIHALSNRWGSGFTAEAE